MGPSRGLSYVSLNPSTNADAWAPPCRDATVLGAARGSAAASPRTCFESHSQESIMIRFAIRFVSALTLVGALVAVQARAQTPETEDNRYQFNRVEDGYLRLDLKSGQV